MGQALGNSDVVGTRPAEWSITRLLSPPADTSNQRIGTLGQCVPAAPPRITRRSKRIEYSIHCGVVRHVDRVCSLTDTECGTPWSHCARIGGRHVLKPISVTSHHNFRSSDRVYSVAPAHLQSNQVPTKPSFVSELAIVFATLTDVFPSTRRAASAVSDDVSAHIPHWAPTAVLRGS